MTSQPGAILGRYEIRSKIGEGGMGAVYLAEDVLLHRKVALKVLPTEFALNKERLRRFKQEATAAAALNHPNIAHIYEIGSTVREDVDGGTSSREETHFIAMEFVDGLTLRELIQSRQTELRKLLRHLQQVAEGLAKAHAAGIVHRDLKPDNIMVTHDGHAKILDFGLAKLAEPKQTSQARGDGISEFATTQLQPLSTPGVVLGTVGYMSPEQAQGKSIDQRSDIFSFGCLLYETATGRKPFVGDSIVDTLHKIIHDPAPAITHFNPSASPELQRIIRKCLAKEPEKRYQTIRDTANDLEELIDEMKVASDLTVSIAPSSTITRDDAAKNIGPDLSAESARSVSAQPASSAEYIVTSIKQHKIATAVIGGLALIALLAGITSGYFYLSTRNNTAIQSIAVMPFVNASGNPEIEYLADGMTETLISSLSQLPQLNVKARSTVFYYKGKEITPQKIGEDLGVQAILFGRVVPSGNDLKLSLELVNTSTQDVIWSEQYDRQQSDLISLQNEIAREVADKLKNKLSGEDAAKLTNVHTANPQAYELYLKGKYHSNQFTKEGLRIAVDSFNQAIATDPNYSRAYSGLAYTYILLDDWFMAPHESVAKARESATKAITIDEADVDAHLVLALVAHWYDWDWKKAEDEFKRALVLNPKNSESYTYYAYFLSSMRRNAEALRIAREGLQIDPLSSLANFGVASALVFGRRWDEAIAHLQNAIKIDPNYWFHRSYLGRAFMHKGMLPEAIAEFQKGVDLDKEQSENWAGLAHVYAVSGKKADAERIVNDLLAKSTKGTYVSPYNIAVIYAGLGDKEKALAWLERAYAERSYYLPVYLTTDERLAPLQSDSRFKDIVRRIGLPE